MMSLFREKMLIFNRCISGSMSNLIEKSWKVSTGSSHFLSPNGQGYNNIAKMDIGHNVNAGAEKKK